ncbi:L-threonylcarbamoyladenylate synthase [Enterovirga aerilata]|uniref:Threonylcarbamoyl-AMP synthase n=1 Tax=Enterovirga aerilata TaxID=2730920 RepID=A0A849I4S4_9HYPH|nr:L-threonylcarbamoyladenylate synthase [Enterovirga sp. DB1703]NNM74836.1 threonylcarbamoyl-AMP synthase [Enterovirga sp. DB1703]
MTGDAPSRATERLGSGADDLARAAAILAEGGLVAFPTETVYGLGADGRNARAVAALYAAKERPRFNPLIGHLPTADAAMREGVFDEDARRLADAFWPGPLTLVVPVSTECSVCDLARAGLDSVALRVPYHPVASALLAACGFPVVAPSANRSGRVSPTEAEHVLADLQGRIDAVVDGGPTRVGVESTIVACLGSRPRLLRPGGLPREAIERVLRHPLEDGHPSASKPLAPGALASHYAPHARVRLEASESQPGEAALSFGPDLPGEAVARLNLSAAGDLAEAAARLFGHLRRLDAAGPDAIAVAPIPDIGLGEAINDRLRRAAAER